MAEFGELLPIIKCPRNLSITGHFRSGGEICHEGVKMLTLCLCRLGHSLVVIVVLQPLPDTLIGISSVQALCAFAGTLMYSDRRF